MPEKQDDTSVRVAVRIRPQLAREKIDACRVCTAVSPDEPQIILGPDRMFTYDNVFDMDSEQEALYQKTVHDLIEGCFEGYNATVFAYGQTGSGKTYSMGTGFEPGLKEDQKGIIPRAVRHLFTGIEERRRSATERSEPPPEFKIYAEFMELYNEEVLDLFDTTRDMESSRHKKSHIKIHEDAGGGIYVVGVTTRTVTSEPETLQALQGGALSRTTASTKMNSQSSRSHAIFTLHIKQQRLIKVTSEIEGEGEGEKEGEKAEGDGMNEFEMLTAKFHFVDLAGSERLKRTGATGDRAKEGISINCGLLALGNVISALGDPTKRSSHVPYRDSKLTRLLQDSLGGNSRTLMIACVSPSDQDFMETLNTLRYANRARNIKNAVIANQDKTSRQLALLRTEIKRLQDELNEYKQGKRSVNSEGVEEINDLFHENTLLQMENSNLRLRIKALQETIDGLTARVALLVAEQARYGMSASTDRSRYTMSTDLAGTDGEDETMTMMTGYITEVEELRAKLVESESMNSALRRKNVDSPVRVNSRGSMMMSPSHGPIRPSSAIFTAPIFENDNYGDEGLRVASVLSDAKKQVEVDQEKIRQVEKRRHSHGGSEKDMESCEEVTDESHESVQDHETEGTKEERGEEDEEEKEEEDADDEDDDDKDSSSSSDSESDEEENAQLQENLAELACEITIKQRLIEELEHSQKRLHTMKMQYEEKLGSLLNKIKETESERDKVLDNLGSMAESRTKDKAEKIRKEFEIKLKKLSEEKDRLTKVQKEHNKILKSKSQFERQMKGLKDEVFKMKETKVKLMKQIREEQQKGRNKDQLSSREIQRLKKESRKKETQIKTLEASAKQRELILKRKHEQLEMLRKNQKPMSDKVAGRLSRPVKKPSTAPPETGQRLLSRRGKAKVDTGRPSKHERKGTSEYSSKTARQKWNKMERKITDIIARRQTISYMERDMERFIHHRHKLSKKVEKYLTKRDEALKAGNKDPSVQKDLDEQIDGLNDNMEYVQEQITECQSGIMEVMEGKEEIDAVDAAAVIEQCSLREAKYMLEHFINLAINKGLSAAQKESQVKELEAKLHQEEQNSFVQQTLLQHMMKEREGEDLDLDGLFSNPNQDSESSSNSSRAPSPIDISALNALAVNVPDHTTLPHIGPANSVSAIPVPTQTKAKDKARRRTATSEELLGFKGPTDFTPDAAVGVVIESDETSSSTDTASVDSSLVLPSSHIPIRKDGRIEKLSPALRRKNITQLQALSNPSSVDHTPDHTPPGSPPPSRTGNVFSRLAQTNSPAQSQKDRGSIIPVINKPTTPRAPLVCSYTAEGHSKAVLSVQATEELLFSGSKDRSVKIWKLDTGKEIATLAGHTNNVGVVRYCEKLKLVFSVSTAFIRIWDIRDTQKCVTTLSSSGMQLDKTAGSSSSRTVTLPQGETQINDIAINESGTRLYSAAGNIVRVWDLSSFQSMCKLFGGPSAAVMCLDVKTTPQFDQVFAGSKDHYVKMFEVEPAASGCLTSSFNFDPPHYDGIQSMAIRGNSLFSGSRDACIKKWDLEQKQLTKAMTNAHKDWICALDFLPSYNCLLSGCRGGYLKLWNIETCTPVGEMKAHTSPINSIATNSTHVFTASSDEIKLWRKSESTRLPSL